MAVTITNLSNPLATRLIVNTDVDESADVNVTGAAAIIYLVEIDNSNNASDTVYLKLYNNASPTVGTTHPDLILPAPSGVKLTYATPQGVSFATALSMACVKTAGTDGTDGPGATVTARLITT